MSEGDEEVSELHCCELLLNYDRVLKTEVEMNDDVEIGNWNL